MVIVIVMIITVFVLTVLKITEDKSQGDTEDTEDTKDTMNEDCDSGWFLISKLNLHIQGTMVDVLWKVILSECFCYIVLNVYLLANWVSFYFLDLVVDTTSFFTEELET